MAVHRLASRLLGERGGLDRFDRRRHEGGAFSHPGQGRATGRAQLRPAAGHPLGASRRGLATGWDRRHGDVVLRSVVPGVPARDADHRGAGPGAARGVRGSGPAHRGDECAGDAEQHRPGAGGGGTDVELRVHAGSGEAPPVVLHDPRPPRVLRGGDPLRAAVLAELSRPGPGGGPAYRMSSRYTLRFGRSEFLRCSTSRHSCSGPLTVT